MRMWIYPPAEATTDGGTGGNPPWVLVAEEEIGVFTVKGCYPTRDEAEDASDRAAFAHSMCQICGSGL